MSATFVPMSALLAKVESAKAEVAKLEKALAAALAGLGRARSERDQLIEQVVMAA